MEELLDTYDLQGNFLGVKPRSFCHSKNPGVYHKVVWIMVKNNQGKILLHKRSKNKKEFPGKWIECASAGHVSSGETCLQTCVKEVYEELGLKTKQSDFKFVSEYLNQDGWELGQLYLLITDAKIEDLTYQKEEIEQLKYVTYKQFLRMLYSSDFCDNPKDYKDFVAKVLKNK